MKNMAKYIIKNYWFNMVIGILCAILTVLAMPLAKDHALQHQEFETVFGWAFAQVVVAPNMPCVNCKNTIFQLHKCRPSNTSLTAVCCVCGISQVEIDCHNYDTILGLRQIFKHDTSKFRLNIPDDAYVPGHMYYIHREPKK